MKLKLINLIILINYLQYSIESKISSQSKCPEMCLCFSIEFDNLKTVQCNGKHIVEPDFEYPRLTELLDLSFNEIAILNEYSFEVSFYNIRHLFFD